MSRALDIKPFDLARLAAAPELWRPQPHFSHVVDAAAQLEQLNESGGIAVRFSGLPNAPVHIAFAGSQSETLSVWTTETQRGFRSTPKLSADLVTIRFVQSGAMSRNGPGGSDIVAGFDQALFTSFEEMRHEQAMPGFSAITATVDRDAIIDACRALGGTDTTILPRFDTVVDLRTVGLAALHRTLRLLRDQLPGRDSEANLMLPLLQDLLIYQFISSWPTTGRPIDAGPVETSDRPVRLAMEFIEAHLRHKIGIGDIAHAAGIGVRALQIAFKRRLGLSPVQYLIARRLDHVHSALRSSEALTVRQTAMAWGFVHMSDFTRRYRERFGQTPMRSAGRR